MKRQMEASFEKGNLLRVKEVVSVMEWLSDFYPRQTTTGWILGCRRI